MYKYGNKSNSTNTLKKREEIEMDRWMAYAPPRFGRVGVGIARAHTREYE
ncbi:hypothetical protein DFA_04885 [Cavenderia fasciculata]|uniref:Uncharacterized protein n=1 Tax=Cavenderia fasciculata TaxID=261658 RepID=F4PM52_CACFS|nr:uncharacterized protein DFA_04885 [Cavenderia fasciculata]EGG22755.1 hypothetical protein DFA_04885 [Cavenderia fasciculata]|eukprot:XP_004360606.1 hypothetical protein DFA_04885 [Cavenderia fasciculata]